MALKRVNQAAVDKTIRVYLRSIKKFFSSSIALRKDHNSESPTTQISGPGSEKSYSAAPSQNFAKSSSGSQKINTILIPTIKQNTEQQTGDYQGKYGNTIQQPSLDTRREITPGGAAEKLNVHILRTNLDQTPSNPQDDVSLLASRRVDPTTVRQVYYFDTLAFTKKLESRGFTREQAEGCAECLVEIINTTLDHQGRHMVTKPQQEIAVQQLMSEIVSVKKDMTLLQKSEFSSLKTETEKISIELSQVQGHMNDEIVKLKGQFSLDINLERGRAIEAHAENEKKLQQLHNKIETEIANLRTIYEVYRNDVFKYAGGTVIAVGGLMLGVIRLWH